MYEELKQRKYCSLLAEKYRCYCKHVCLLAWRGRDNKGGFIAGFGKRGRSAAAAAVVDCGKIPKLTPFHQIVYDIAILLYVPLKELSDLTDSLQNFEIIPS